MRACMDHNGHVDQWPTATNPATAGVRTIPGPMDAITAEGLVKIYRGRKSEVRALDGLNLTVAEGTVLGLLGPNGAGKTTTVRILATLLKPDAGHATVAGYDVVKDAHAVAYVGMMRRWEA